MVLSPERNKNTEEKSNDVTHTAHYEVRETKESETLLVHCVCVNSHMRFKGEGSPFNSSNLTKRRRKMAPHLIDRDVPLIRGVVELSPVEPSKMWVPVCITYAVLCT